MSTNAVPGPSRRSVVWQPPTGRHLFWGVALILLSFVPFAVAQFVVSPSQLEISVFVALFVSGVGLLLGRRIVTGDLLLVCSAAVFLFGVFRHDDRSFVVATFAALPMFGSAAILAVAGAVHLAGPSWINRD